jgi:hypothetical protein
MKDSFIHACLSHALIGSYEVSLSWNTAPNRASSMFVKITHASGTDIRAIGMSPSSLSKVDPVTKYFKLGAFYFNAGQGHLVLESGVSGLIVADSVKLMCQGS